ncbi:IS630 family transposase [Mycetohabitans sp. B8]|uniref:IS630 family transposase n=1 Tax=Mycetohabitans sp. B8 TaxID=2841845 RepID=UPI00210202EE|nr:IS630 family transposase [Mycetohabitans sp. B8]
MGRKGIEVMVSERERKQLLSMSRSRSLPHSLVRRAKIVLMAADGHTNQEIAMQCEVTSPAITHWKKRFVANGLAGLHDEARPGRPRAHDDEAVAELLARVLHEKPNGATHWSVRSAAAQTGISKSSVARYLSLFGVQPHRSKSFKLSNDPYFVEKVCDIVGLYLSPPTHALVLCVDEKSQCQALERTQPMLPMGLGYLEGVTQRFVQRLAEHNPQIASIRRLSLEFTDMVKRRAHQALASWLRQAQASGVPERQRFAAGIGHDYDAVHAARLTPYSNGIVEGHVNRLKLLKRQMYGRVGFQLLRTRVLNRC